MSEMDKYYQILGLNPGASEEEIKQAYKDLVNVWHPDRFPNNQRLREKANEKLKEINEAYEKLKSHIAEETDQCAASDTKSQRESKPPPHEPPPSGTNGGIVVQTEPEGAVIAINGEPVGISRYERVDLPPGLYKVRATLQGYEIWEHNVIIRTGVKQEVRAKLELKEQPFKREKEQSSTTENGGYGESEPPPNEAPLEAERAGAIWNPNATTLWSLPFTPAFGSYLQMLNWRTLGEHVKASSAQSWFYASLLILFISFLMGMFVSDAEVLYSIIWWLSILYLIAWYFAAGRSQVKYVKAKFGKNYPKKPWGQALLIAVGALIGCWVVAFALGFIFRAVTTKDNIHTAMENKLEQYRVKDQPQEAPLPEKPQVVPREAPVPLPTSSSAEVASQIQTLKEIVEKDPKNLPAWVELGNLYFDSDQPKEAIEAYSHYLAVKSENPDVRTDLGIMYRKLGQFDKALEEFRMAARSDPKHINSRYNIGLVLLHDKGDIKGAIKAFEDYLKVDPNSERAQRIRAQIEKMKDQELEKISSLFENIRQANLQKNIDLFMSCFSRDFNGTEGKRKDTLKMWETFNYHDLSYDLKKQTISGDTADVRLEWLVRTSEKVSGKPHDGKTVLDVTLKREDGQWKIKEIRPVS